MNERLCGLLRRFTSPVVVSRLTKEELCLSMVALTRLRLRKEQLLPLVSKDVLAVRAQRVSHACTPMELGIIAEGAEALFCNRMDLADTLVDEMYGAVKKGVQTRLGHAVATVRYTASVGAHRNETAVALLGLCGRLLQKNDSASVLTTCVRLARSYLTSEELHSLLEELHKRATEEQREAIEAACNQQKTERAPETRSGDVGDDHEDEETATWTALRARQWMSEYVRGNKPPSPGDAVQAMELYAHFAVRDSVLHEKIQDLALETIALASKFHLEEMYKAVLRSPSLFTRVRGALGELRSKSADAQGSGGSAAFVGDTPSSLTTTSTTSRAYDMLLAGRRLSEDVMFDVMKEQSDAPPADVVAQTACLFAEKGDIPEGVIVRLSGELSHISSRGVAALVRASRRDSSRALRPHCEVVFVRFADGEIRDATVETLLQIAEAFQLPLPRDSVSGGGSYASEAEGKLREALVAQLFSVMQGSCNVSFLCRVAKAVHTIDLNEEVVQYACSAIRIKGALTESEALLVFDMLRYRNYIHEQLLDSMEPVFSRLVQSVTSMIGGEAELSDVDVRYVARFAALQAEFDCPDFEASAALLMHAVEERTSSAPTELLPAVGLLCRSGRRWTTLQAIFERLNGEMEQLSNEAVSELAQLLVEAESLVTKEIAQRFHSLVLTRLANQHVLPPDTVGWCAVVCARQGDTLGAIDEQITDYLLEWMYALSSKVYTSLCSVAYLSSSLGSLASGLMEDFPRRLELLTTREISDVAFGLGEVTGMGERLSHQLVTERCSDYVVDYSQEFWSGKDISRLLYGFSRMHCTKRSLYNVFATRLANRLIFSLMDQAAISLAVAAFGRVKYLDKKLFDRFSRWIMDHSKDLKAAELLFTIRGFSRVMLLNNSLYADLGSKAAEKVAEFPVESQCAILSSFGSLGIEHEKLSGRLVASIAENRDELTDATAAVEVITSLWLMNYDIDDDKHVAQLADWVAERAGELTEEAVGKLCLVLTDTNWRHAALVRAIAEQSVKLHAQQSISPKCCREVLDMLGTFMIHHQGARENLSALGRSVSKEVVQLSEEEEQHLQLLLRR
uniref:Uncharacterized protein TCIL3000_11_8090 n=1 Tax=Trypanosoma congolense (strain IL3000) TaxID=1068625 RepID=G0V140_TRYCI|nr:unnamed protein product [Trypanosoma congolense IL3000]